MNSCLKAMEARLTDEQKEMLKAIREPVVVAVPLEDSRRDICVLPDGEIRSYGHETLCFRLRPRHITGKWVREA